MLRYQVDGGGGMQAVFLSLPVHDLFGNTPGRKGAMGKVTTKW